jgi:hypothetical protein
MLLLHTAAAAQSIQSTCRQQPTLVAWLAWPVRWLAARAQGIAMR